jgi:hypothetical protein
MSGRRTRRALLAAVLAVLMLVGLVPAAGARPPSRDDLATISAELWRGVLEIPQAPTDQAGPYFTGACLELGGVLAPFSGGSDDFSCLTRFGEPVFVLGYGYEESVAEARATNPPIETSEAALAAYARSQVGAEQPLVCYDGRRLPLDRVQSPLTRARLPEPNLTALPAQRTKFVAVSDVALVVPAPGRHSIVITQPAGTLDGGSPEGREEGLGRLGPALREALNRLSPRRGRRPPARRRGAPCAPHPRRSAGR